MTTITIQTQAFQAALKLVASAIGTSQTLEGSDTLLFTEGFVHSYSGMASVSAPIKDADGNPAQLSGVLKAKPLTAWVSKLKGDLLTIEIESGAWELSCGRSSSRPAPIVDQLSAHLAALDLSSLQWADLPEDFASAVTLVRLENGKTQTPVLRFKRELLLAMDNFRMNSYSFPDSVDLGDYAIKTEHAKELAGNADLRQFAVSTGWAHYLAESGAVLTVKRMDGSASYRDDMHLGALRAVGGAEVLMETELPVGTVDAVNRVTAYSGTDKDSGTVAVKMFLKADTLQLTSKRMEGEALETLEWPVKLPEDTDTQMALSAPFIVEAANRGVKLQMKQITGKDKAGNEAKSVYPTFASDKYLQIVRPLAV